MTKRVERLLQKRVANACHALHLLGMVAELAALTEDDISLVKREISREVRDLFARLDAGLGTLN